MATERWLYFPESRLVMVTTPDERLTGDIVATVSENAHRRGGGQQIAALPEVLDALELLIMMLRVEANDHRFAGATKKADAVDGAIGVAVKALQLARPA